MFTVDPIHDKIDVMKSKMVHDVWRDKYRWQDEKHIEDTFHRVANAIFPPGSEHSAKAFSAMSAGLFIPGGRILAGAGTEKRVTLMNCYVNETLEDSLEGIMHGLTNTALTLQQGGGIGTDFSTLRPEGAILTRTHTKASGPLPFMHMWNSSSATIRSAGDRRGAMMGTMADTHPDLPKLIVAKNTAGALTQFNISVLISDAFMEAVKEDEDWVLYFHIAPLQRDETLMEYDFIDDQEVTQYAYSVHKARSLWELITRNTYEYSEPGVIFIDRVNDLNNLFYCEKIRCTNPCGEQPLPPHGTCNLGHINLARCVRDPFTSKARVDYALIDEVTKIAVRFLDAVIEATRYPLVAQEQEELSKRRLGLGFTGLADLLSQINVRYGSPDAARITEEITRRICFTAYKESIEMAKELGSFPLYDKEQYFSGFSFASTTLPPEITSAIRKHGIRNSHLLTLAPVGTGSIVLGNVSSSCEPVFLHKTERRVLKSTGGFKDDWETYVEWGYGALLVRSLHKEPDGMDLPTHMVTAEDLTVEEHVVMQAAAQKWIDSSVSKTINVPEATSYHDFVKVYDLAYTLGCKGCTTYRPNPIRGSILSKPGEAAKAGSRSEVDQLPVRPDVLTGKTYKITWPSLEAALYLTVNSDEEGKPFEVFIGSKDAKYQDWTTALTVMITSIFRKGGDISFVARELQTIQSLNDGNFKEGRHHPSLAAYIGFILEKHINGHAPKQGSLSVKCPKCHQSTLHHSEGCLKCSACGFSECG